MCPCPPALHLTVSGAAGDAQAGPFTLAAGEVRKIDVTLRYAFFDEPNFMVAGVTDPISRGGHGSDDVPRSAEDLAKATAALSTDSSPAAAAEKGGQALKAVREYQHAAEQDARESNLFNWGAELLKHRAAEPAVEVFAKGHRLYPDSLRMLLGLAASWYARGDYGQAATFFFAACDLRPDDPQPYLFLGKVQSPEITRTEGYLARCRRFAERHPANAWADYYYAAALWTQRQGPEDTDTPTRVLDLLEKAVGLDAHLAVAYLQMGIVYADRNRDTPAIAAFEKALGADPRLNEAHYRLGQCYSRTGQKEKARRELQIYQEMTAQSAAEAQRERNGIPQFLYQLRDKQP